MAMSIEGYIANVKKNIRVSPATTIKNLSHSPYIYEDINHRVNAGRLFSTCFFVLCRVQCHFTVHHELNSVLCLFISFVFLSANADATTEGDDAMSVSEEDGGDEGTEEMDPTSDNEADFAAAVEGNAEGGTNDI